MRENTDQNNSEYGHFLRSVLIPFQFETYCPFNKKDHNMFEVLLVL